MWWARLYFCAAAVYLHLSIALWRGWWGRGPTHLTSNLAEMEGVEVHMLRKIGS